MNLKDHHAAVLLEGYSAFRTVLSDGDANIAWIEYRLPADVAPDQAVARVVQRLRVHRPCFRPVEVGELQARLHCVFVGSDDVEEYVIAVTPGQRSVQALNGHPQEPGYSLAIREFRATTALAR